MPIRIPLARPTLGPAELAAVERVLASGRLVAGAENQAFEAELAARCGRRHAVAVASGTVALELAMWAGGIGPGAEVLVPAFGFPAAAMAATRCGARPVPVDVDARTWNLDLDAARAACADSARAVVSIDQLGLVAESAPLCAFAAATGQWVLADSACALGGADSRGVPGGGYGRLAILSFHPRKIITTGEGGAVLCDDDDLAGAVRELRNLGQAAPGRFVRAGTNARLSEVAAALGRAQLARLDAHLAERRLLAAGYHERLAPLADSGLIAWQEAPPGAMHSYQTFAVLLAPHVERDRVRAALAAAEIESGPATYALHRCGPEPREPGPFLVADALHDRALALPFYVGMRSPELDRVAETLTEALA
jgi:dTDP-4-amino-4,6-dideoxygalactose transaminase